MSGSGAASSGAAGGSAPSAGAPQTTSPGIWTVPNSTTQQGSPGAAPTPTPAPNTIAPNRPGLTGQPQSPSTPANPGQQATPGVPQPTGPNGATQQPSTAPNSVKGGANIGSARGPGRGPIGSVAPGAKSGSDNSTGGTRNLVADCMALWDRGTHMTKIEWRRTCQRTKNALDQLPN